MDRRHFIQSATAATAGLGAANLSAGEPAPSAATEPEPMDNLKPTFIATWKFGLPACQKAVAAAAAGTMIDGIEQGIKVTESDVSNPTVGIGGTPNADGVVELDACIMSGPRHEAGGVAGIQDIKHPISVARKVMEATKHCLLVGPNATKFALENGFSKTSLLTENRKQAYEKWKKEKSGKMTVNEFEHDTIAMVGIDSDGNLYGGCSTSGMGYKMPGRVGDSPILGSGLYLDNHVGAAGATGIGENVMRHCASFMIVEFMRQGLSPELAIEAVIRRIVETDPRKLSELSINFIAINKHGEHAAVGTDKGFAYAWANADDSAVVPAKILK